MRKLFKSCGSWNPGWFQITSFQMRTCVLCGWFESMLALTQVKLKRRTRIKNLCLKVCCSPRSKKECGWLKHQIIIIGGIEELWKKKNKTVTFHSPFKQEVEFALCFRIQTNKAFFRSSRKMNSISFVFFIMTARTWSRCYPTSIEKNGTIRFGTSVSRKNTLWAKSSMIYPNGMRKLEFKNCGSWNPGSFQITSFQVRTCVLCGWYESMLALTQVQLKRRTRIKNLCLLSSF